MRRKSTRKKETEFEKLARLIKGEGEDIRHEMIKRFDAVSKQFDSTNRRFDAVDEQLREIRTELSDIRRRVERLEEQGAIQAGYAKEIDFILQRVTFIEKHLGIKSATRK